MVAAPEKKLIHSFRQGSHHVKLMIFGLEFRAIGKKRKHFGVIYIFFLIDEVLEYGERSSWLDPAMDKSNFHCFLIN